MPVKIYFEKIQNILLTHLNKAETQVVVAVAWLTDSLLFDKLCQLASEGIDVQILILKDEININSNCNYENLIKQGGKVYWQDNTNNTLMHHKFCVIDKKEVITGSYNWTNKATYNNENITVIEDENNVATQFLSEFKSLVPQFTEASFYDDGYLSSDYFNTHQKRLKWFSKLPNSWQETLLVEAKGLDFFNQDINDESFEDALWKIFQIEDIILGRRHDTLLPLENLSRLKSITYIDSTKLSDLSPLRNLLNLEKLNMGLKRITDITPLAKLKKLKYLNLSNNCIEDASIIQNFKKLETCWISLNKIDDISFLSNCNNLKDVRFDKNFVGDLSPLLNKEKLYRLDFEENKVQDLSPLENCLNLETVACDNNLISDISPLKRHKYLRCVKCLQNSISEKNLSSFRIYSKALLY